MIIEGFVDEVRPLSSMFSVMTKCRAVFRGIDPQFMAITFHLNTGHFVSIELSDMQNTNSTFVARIDSFECECGLSLHETQLKVSVFFI